MFGKSNTLLLVSLLAAAALTAACLPTVFSEPSLTVVGALETGGEQVSEARILVTRGKHVLERAVPVQQNEFQGTLQIPVGKWEITVLLVDEEGIVRFQSKPQEVEISPGSSTILELVLQPAASTVYVTIDLSDYVFKHQALRARIHFNDTIYEVIRPDSSVPLEAVLEISPGSYEFKIELYTESFHVGSRLGQGSWQVVHVSENEDLFITWKPETEGLHISGRVETPLPAPGAVALTGAEAAVHISWEAVDHWNVQGYFLLAQLSPLDRFQLLTPSPIPETSFVHSLGQGENPDEITYVVAAVSSSGRVGYYSQPQVWRP